MADRIAVIRAGRIEQVAAPDIGPAGPVVVSIRPHEVGMLSGPGHCAMR